jgi:hypothetical protein
MLVLTTCILTRQFSSPTSFFCANLGFSATIVHGELYGILVAPFLADQLPPPRVISSLFHFLLKFLRHIASKALIGRILHAFKPPTATPAMQFSLFSYPLVYGVVSGCSFFLFLSPRPSFLFLFKGSHRHLPSSRGVFSNVYVLTLLSLLVLKSSFPLNPCALQSLDDNDEVS